MGEGRRCRGGGGQWAAISHPARLRSSPDSTVGASFGSCTMSYGRVAKLRQAALGDARPCKRPVSQNAMKKRSCATIRHVLHGPGSLHKAGHDEHSRQLVLAPGAQALFRLELRHAEQVTEHL